MKKILLFLLLIFLSFIAIKTNHHNKNKSIRDIPAPTEKTIVIEETENYGEGRKKWIESMHRTAPGIDWQSIERQNAEDNARLKLKQLKSASNRNAEDTIVPGVLVGKWIERGSNNQAGSMLGVNYFTEEDMLIGKSAGGSLWIGDRSGFDWKVLNDDYYFDADVYGARYNAEGDIRYIAALNGRMVYSDDQGVTWNYAEGMDALESARIRDFLEPNDDIMMVLQKAHNIYDLKAYTSTDDGTSWQAVHTFDTKALINIKLAKIANTDHIIAIEQKDSYLSRLSIWSPGSNTFEVVNENAPIGFGPDNHPANINAHYDGDTLRLFVLDHNQNLMTSLDTGITWTQLSTLPTTPWSVGIFVSPSDYKHMYYGEVNAYRSVTGGKSWTQINPWYTYYDDILTQLHADIMSIHEFIDQEGKPFNVMCNHGGVYQSYNYGEDYTNIGLFTLNISQYYSVATHPEDRDWIFAGAQDQGFQRGKIYQEEISSLDQVISGDYGHIVFTGADHHLWTVYPYGDIYFYKYPKSQGPTQSWSLANNNQTVWIVPLTAHPDPNKDVVFVAGGSINENENESHLISLTADQMGNISAHQFDFDFSKSGGVISAIAVSPHDYNTIFVMTDNGHIYKSIDGGASFEEKQINLPGGHYLYGSCILPSSIDADVIYLSGSGYSNPGVYVSTDGGESFEPMGQGLPHTLVFNLAPNEDESLIYAATEAGPYVFVTDQGQWYPLFGKNTPTQRYWSVEYIKEQHIARFGTYGRGIWDFKESMVELASQNQVVPDDFSIYPNPFTKNIHINIPKYFAHATLIIRDVKGKIMYQNNIDDQKKYSINLSYLSPGMYFATLKTKTKLITKKILKQ